MIARALGCPQLFRDAWLNSELAAKLYVDDRVDRDGNFYYLDKVGSVSASQRDETTLWPTEDYLDEQYRRFLRADEGGR